MNWMVKLLIGVNFTVAVIFIYDMTQQQKQDKEMAVDKEEMKVESERFNEDLERFQFELADDNESKLYHKNKMRFHKAAADRMEESKAEAIRQQRELQEKTDAEFAKMQDDLDKFGEKHGDEIDKAFDTAFDF